MTPKTRELMECVADIAFMAGAHDYYGGDSRQDISNFIQWAIEFESKRIENADGSVTYDGKEYMDAINDFVNVKLENGEGRDHEPPDPDSMNDRRAEWAAQTIERFQFITRTDDEDAVADLLNNLMHYCDRSSQSFQHQLRRARGMYRDETSEEPEDLVMPAETRAEVIPTPGLPMPYTPAGDNEVPF